MRMQERLEHESTHLITGANTGIGAAIAVALVERGARVILACRSRIRTQPLLDRLGSRAQFVELDLASLASVQRAAEEIASAGIRIDTLVNNAGVGGARGLSTDGFELAFAANCLGHYALTRALLPSLREGGRIVHLGSGSHRQASELDWDALQRPTRSLTGIPEYAASKLAVLRIHLALSQHITALDRGLMSLVADPGDVASDAWRHIPQPFRALFTMRMKPPTEGARTPLFCITTPHLPNGGCYVDDARERVSDAAMDLARADEAWTQCARWTGFAP